MRKETTDNDILVTSRNCDKKKYATYQSKEQTSFKKKEVEPAEPVQMNIYQSNTYRKDLNYLHFDNEPKVPKR